jgi:putative salt-induced outer membrane protein YdiY
MVVLSMLIMAGYVRADEVRLKNGDHLTGEVVTMENDKLILKTSYAGEIKISWKEVASIQTDAPIAVILNDESALKGITQPADGGKMKLDTEKFDASFSLADVKSINPKPIPAVMIKANVNAGLDIERGNTETDKYYLDGDFVARTEKSRYSIGAEFTNEKADGVNTSDRWLAYGKYDYFLSDKWYLFASGLFENDEFKDLNLRSRLTAGAGYQFFETPITNLSLEAGLSYVNEDFIIAEDNDYPAGAWSLDYDRWFFDKILQFYHRHTGSISLEDSEDIFVKTRTGFRIPIYKGLNVGGQFRWDWDNNPSPGTKNNDYRYLLTLGWYFDNR